MLRRDRLNLILAILIGLTTSISPLYDPLYAEVISSQQHRFNVEEVAGGLEHPWGLAFLPNRDILVTERPGRLRYIQRGNSSLGPYLK